MDRTALKTVADIRDLAAKGEMGEVQILAKVKGIVKGAIKIIPTLTYRQRYEQSLGRDPLICKHCQQEMGVWKIWHPKYGVVYDELEQIRKGRYGSARQRAPA